MKTNRKMTKITGVLFLLPLLAYGIGNGLIATIIDKADHLQTIPEYSARITAGALLMLVNSLLVMAIGITLFPQLKLYNKNIALLYLVSRVTEGILLAVGVICLLLLLTLGDEYVKDASYFDTLSAVFKRANYLAYQFAMIFLGLGSLFFCYLLYRSGLLPRFISLWGFAGYFLLLAGAVSELLGFKAGVLFSVPGGLFEIFLAFRLIFKGFNVPEMVVTNRD